VGVGDNEIQAPDYSQSFNRYSYAWNNPLKFTDPSGEIVLSSLFVGGVMALFSHVIANGMMDNIGQAAKVFGIGALSSAIGAVTGGAAVKLLNVKGILPGAMVGGATSVVGSSFVGGISSMAFGGNFWDGFKKVSLISGLSGAIGGGVIGSHNAAVEGRNLWWGSDPDLRDGGWIPGITVRPFYHKMPGDSDLPDFLQWCPCRGNVPDNIPYWWGETDLMANPITKMRVLGYGSEVMWATLAIPAVTITALNPTFWPSFAYKDGWHFGALGYHTIGKTVANHNGYAMGKYLHLNIYGKHFIFSTRWRHMYNQATIYWKYLK